MPWCEFTSEHGTSESGLLSPSSKVATGWLVSCHFRIKLVDSDTCDSFDVA